MIVKIFHVNSHHRNGHYQTIDGIHILGENPGIHPCYHFYDFSLKNDNLGLKIKILKFPSLASSQFRAVTQEKNSKKSNF